MTNLKLGIIIGSTRPNRFSEKPAQWIFEQAKKLDGVDVELIDLRDHPMPFFDEPQSPSMVQDGNYGNDVLNAWAKLIGSFDAYVMVSPEYNHGTSAVLKNALDVVYKEWNNKAVGFVSYGSVGGARAVEQLRLIAIELQMAPVRQGVHIPAGVVFGGPDAWNDEAKSQLQNAADTMLHQVKMWGSALRDARQKA